MTAAIIVSALAKSYGRTVALADVSFSVQAGSVYGLIGPNAAGKTTTLAILAGLLDADSGTASVSVDAQHIGFYSPQFGLFDYLTGREILVTCGRLQGVSRNEIENRANELLSVLDLQEAADHYLYEYSLGMRNKLGLATALIHAPQVLLLDEPFEGLDTASVYRIVKLLKRMAQSGRAILLTSHDLALVERVCDRVGVLHRGVIVREFELSGSEESQKASTELESRLWQLVGTPKEAELSWIS